MNKMVSSVLIAYGVPRDAASIERHPPYNVPSASPVTIGSMPEPGTAAISQCDRPSREDFQLATCSRSAASSKSRVIIGPWKVTSFAASANHVSSVVASLYPTKILG